MTNRIRSSRIALEAMDFLGDVETAVVKTSTSRNFAKCLPISDAHSLIRKTLKRAIDRIGKYKPFPVTLPAKLELIVYRSDMADKIANNNSSVDRIDARTLRRKLDTLLAIVHW